MGEEFEAVVEQVRERVEPGDDERVALESAVEGLVSRAEAAAEDLPVEVDVVLAGSTARDTWLAGERDVDIFLRFPPDIEREQLREYGLAVGHAVLPESREEYAEHPYVVGEFEGFGVDIVPCYALADATDIRSAVDRTPFHTRYVRARLDSDLAGDVRVCKQFFTGIGVYGSDLRTRGFSGFLTELLVLEYGGFRELVEAAADWTPPVELDPEGHGDTSFDDPLVVIDPTDPGRNVAAVLSAANLARFQHYARDLLADPRGGLFVQPTREPLDAGQVREAFDDRGTTPVALRFTTPDVVDDQLWPQLERSLSGVTSELDRRGFDVFRADAFAEPHESGGDGHRHSGDDDTASTGDDDTDTAGANSDGDSDRAVALLFELAVAERPTVERHEGPPVHVRSHAESFHGTYADGDAYGPFIDGDRYVVERGREFTAARAFLDSDALLDAALGAAIERALAGEYDLLVGPEVGELADSFGAQLARYLDPTTRGC